MKILVLIHEFPPVGGGGGRAAEDLCRALVKRGHEVRVLTAHLKGLPLRETLDGIDVLRLRSLRREAFRASLLAMGAYCLAGLPAGFRLIKAWRPDVVHVHFAVPAGVLAWALSRLTGIPYVLTAHLGDVPGGVPEKTGGWFKWIFPFTHPIWRDAQHVIAVSEFTRRLALRHYPVEIQVIPNGVDLEKLRPASLRVNDPPRIVFAGRLMAQKNPLQIVRTLRTLRELPWECVLIGDGPLMGELRRAVSESGLRERFTLTGWVTPEEVLDWFDRGDILFMPSLSEGLPVVGVQALAKGLAFVVSDIGGFMDLVQDRRNGFLVDTENPDGYLQAMRDLLADRKRLASCRAASLEISTRFDLARVAGKYEEVLGEVPVAH